MVITRKSIPRRTFLRGTGAVLALPVLDAMTPALSAETQWPIRMSFIEVPNGIMMDRWTPATEGADFELTPVLQPLAQFRDRMLVLSGLDQQQSAARENEVAGDHPRACTAWLTGAHAKMTAGADLRAGISVDQMAAKEFGKYTQLASLEVGLESAEVLGSCESAYSCAYYNTISWRNETTPLPMENRPRAIFERLFGDAGMADAETRAARREDDRASSMPSRRMCDGCAQSLAGRTAVRSTSIWRRCAMSSGACSWPRNRSRPTRTTCRSWEAPPGSRRCSRNTTS